MTTADGMVLAADFPPVTRGDWEAQIEAVLKGKPTSSLATTTADGVEIQPLYTAGPDREVGTPGSAPYTRGATALGGVLAGWDVRQHYVVTDASSANQAILDDLANGVTSVWLRVDDPAHLPPALRGVLLDAATVALDGGSMSGELALAFLDVAATCEAAPSDVRGSLRLDPVGVLARHGELHVALAQAHAEMAATAVDVARRFPSMRTVAVDGSVWTDAGASDADELAGSLSVAVGYLRALVAAGLDVDTALGQIEFTWTARADQFSTVAKLRAARRLWSRVAEVSGASAAANGQYQHAVTSAGMLSRRDPWVNLLRTTVAAFAAGVGGADAVTVLPFDTAIGLADADARRLARNIQLLGIEESHLARVIDPAGGSHFVETLTGQLARVAWARFQDLERGGGMGEVLVSGGAAEYLARRWGARRGALVRRKESLTGVSEFPDVNEAPLSRPAVPARPRRTDPGLVIDALPLRRLAEPFEQLRDAADSAPERPSVFSANLGPASDHTARATWAKNLFQVAGIEVLGNDGFGDERSLVAAFQTCGTSVAVICSSDDVYAERAGSAASALRAAGATTVYLAGRPGEREDEWRHAGVDEFVFAGVDVVDVGVRALARFGVEVAR